MMLRCTLFYAHYMSNVINQLGQETLKAIRKYMLYSQSDSDVISLYLIYASCFSVMMWGKLWELFVIVTSLS